MDLKFIAIIFSAILLNFMIVAHSQSIPPDTGNNVCQLSKDKHGLDLANGTQNPNGECVETFMGEVPDTDHMTSSIFLFPKNDEVLKAGEAFTVKLAIINIHTGFFDNPATQYYLFPQTLDDNGVIQGHSHVTIQLLESEDKAPNPKVFAFFKGLNEPDVNGVLNTTVDKGLETPGLYRICSMSSSFGHQPLLMPVAQRGAQDDCVRFTVVDDKKKMKRGFQNHHRRI